MSNSPDIRHETVVAKPANGDDEWWSANEADEVEGYDLVKDEALEALVGVPFMITGAIFRDGLQLKGVPYRSDFVSLELRIAPASMIQKRVSAGRLNAMIMAKVLPGELLVINDGSTGIYRQIVQYLAAKELITLPAGKEEGEKGETIYDLPRSEWVSGGEEGGKGFEIMLRCSRGLRYSEYSNNYTGDDTVKTWYIA